MCEIAHTAAPAPAGAATVVPPTELSNAAVAVGASMARAVIAAEIYRQTGKLPGFAAPTERTPDPCP